MVRICRPCRVPRTTVRADPACCDKAGHTFPYQEQFELAKTVSRLFPEAKVKLRTLIDKVPVEVEQSDADRAQRDKIFNILSDLAKEVSKDRVGFERFAGLARI